MSDKKMFNKKGIEISINFIVILVLAIFIFGLSVWFLKAIFSQTLDIYDETSSDLDKQIGFVSCGNQVSCINTDTLEIQRGDYKTFGIKVYNNRKDLTIKVRVQVKYDDEVNPADSEDYFSILFGTDVPSERVETLKPGDSKQLGVGVVVKKMTASDLPVKSGKYVFNVKLDYCIDYPANFGGAKENGCSSSGVPNNAAKLGDGLHLLYVVVP